MYESKSDEEISRSSRGSIDRQTSLRLLRLTNAKVYANIYDESAADYVEKR